jgi:hypothetical protein
MTVRPVIVRPVIVWPVIVRPVIVQRGAVTIHGAVREGS